MSFTDTASSLVSSGGGVCEEDLVLGFACGVAETSGLIVATGVVT